MRREPAAGGLARTLHPWALSPVVSAVCGSWAGHRGCGAPPGLWGPAAWAAFGQVLAWGLPCEAGAVHVPIWQVGTLRLRQTQVAATHT